MPTTTAAPSPEQEQPPQKPRQDGEEARPPTPLGHHPGKTGAATLVPSGSLQQQQKEKEEEASDPAATAAATTATPSPSPVQASEQGQGHGEEGEGEVDLKDLITLLFQHLRTDEGRAEFERLVKEEEEEEEEEAAAAGEGEGREAQAALGQSEGGGKE